MKAFITGSHAYGKPHRNSDVDIVILADKGTIDLLEAKSDVGQKPIRFGKLNIIATDNEKRFSIWQKGTNALRNWYHQRGETVSREEATLMFDMLFLAEGMPKSSDDSGGHEESYDENERFTEENNWGNCY